MAVEGKGNMAKERMVNTFFWDKKYVRSLTPHGKLLFLYLITNPLTNIAGAYEITEERIEFDTGLSVAEIQELLAKFSADGKAEFRDGWLVMINAIEHQKIINKKIRVGIENVVNGCPDWIKDRLSIAYDWLSHLKESNLNKSNLNTNTNEEPQAAACVPETESTESPYEEIFIGTILAGLAQRMDVKTLSAKLDWQKAGRWAIANDFTADHFLECFELLQKQHWRYGPVKPSHVTENLPNLKKLRDEIAKNAKRNTDQNRSDELDVATAARLGIT